MNGVILSPPMYQRLSGPLIFLGGPIKGAPDWQADAIAYLHHRRPALHLANPRRDPQEWEFSKAAQADWERHHLKLASDQGVILFWCPGEGVHDCSRPYGQTTRFELGEWKVYHEFLGTKLVVGFEEGARGAFYARRRFSLDCPDVPLCSTLEETCNRSLEFL